MIGQFVAAVRRNHALEHATVSVLLMRLGPSFRLVGRAVQDGYLLYADLPTELVTEASHEALERLRRGESYLAVSPLCGTNIAVGGVLAGLSSMMALGPNDRSRLDRVPNVCMAAAFGIIAAQPIGRLVQRYVTTDANMGDLEIASITAHGSGITRFHKIRTSVANGLDGLR
jgi:hypothetical protein